MKNIIPKNKLDLNTCKHLSDATDSKIYQLLD